MKRFPSYALILALAIVAAGCAEDPLTAALDAPGDGASSASSDQGHYAHPLSLSEARRPVGGDGFASPLFGLDAAPNGDILVADAGAGVANAAGGLEIDLPGVTDVASLGRGSMWASRAGMIPTEDSGQSLYRISQGQTRLIANLFAYEEAQNPDGAEVDSNPFDVASLGGSAALVADAGGNTLLRVRVNGQVETVAVFPVALASTSNFNQLAGCPPTDPFCATGGAEFIPAQAVPTSVAVGPDGYYYVGELKGFPAPTNESSVWRIAPGTTDAMCPSASCTKVLDGGFTSIIDLVFGPDGRLYVVELDEASWAAVEIFGLVTGGTVNACDLGTGTCEEVATGLPVVTAAAFGRGDQLWVTENALVPGVAQVVALP